jgi:hypothetical protein
LAPIAEGVLENKKLKRIRESKRNEVKENGEKGIITNFITGTLHLILLQ